MAVVETHQLSKHYGEFTALDKLSISVEQGEILGFIGPNGAGKTTTIKILVGLLRPTGGSASISGADCVRDSAKIKRLVGYMPDKFGSYDNMRVAEYLDFFGAAFGISRKERGKRIDYALETTNAEHMRDLYVESLSHGMQQRVGIARTLLHDPEVMILDEPANGLDPQARIDMRELLLRLADMRKTLIVTSHILPELSRICNVVAIITKGKLRAFGGLDEIMRRINQRRMFEVQLIDGGQVDQARPILADALECSPDEVSTSSTERLVRFDSNRSDQELSALLAHLIERGVAVAQFREVQTDLEDAFLSVTRMDDQDDSQEAAASPEPADESASQVEQNTP